jgi:hypothetical protein
MMADKGCLAGDITDGMKLNIKNIIYTVLRPFIFVHNEYSIYVVSDSDNHEFSVLLRKDSFFYYCMDGSLKIS